MPDRLGRAVAYGALLLALLALRPDRPAAAASPGCTRASEVAEQARRDLAGGADPRDVLRRLQAVMEVCSSSSEVFRLAACCAERVSDPRARSWRDRAVLNGATDTSCPGTPTSTSAPESRVGTTPATPTPSVVGPVRHKYALLVGLSSFADPHVPHLNYPAKDATDLRNVLVDPRRGRFLPENVVLLTDAAATRVRILDELQNLIIKAAPDDLVLLYVSSHGSPNEQGHGLQGMNSIGYIVTYDTAVSNIYRDAIEYQDFAHKVAELIRARRKAIFLDTCYSGQVAPSGAKALESDVGLDEATARLFLSGEGTYVVMSSQRDEKSWESESLKNSYFTYYLMEALRPGNDPPTIKDVFEHMKDRVPPAVLREHPGQSQHPVMSPSGGAGDLRIGVLATLER
jgi:hypothetical protein